jgi:hypothetical protein
VTLLLKESLPYRISAIFAELLMGRKLCCELLVVGVCGLYFILSHILHSWLVEALFHKLEGRGSIPDEVIGFFNLPNPAAQWPWGRL